MKPEEKARKTIDELLTAAGWDVQESRIPNLAVRRGVAICETNMTTGFADYLLVVDKKVIGVVEAKPEGYTLSGALRQARNYSRGTRQHMRLWLRDESLEDWADLRDPDEIAEDMIEDLEAALEQLQLITADLGEETPG